MIVNQINFLNLKYKIVIAISHKTFSLEHFQKTCDLNNGKIQDYDLISNLMNKYKFLMKMANKKLV
tara:strand:+ start:438 stop:635 length:198 start_codon:yes stop_codon:yes gene_type:complete